MILVVASRYDEGAREIVARWKSQDASLVTCEDLSTCGWQHRLFSPNESRVVASGRVVQENQISGVLVRRFCVFEQELVHIAASDREYVATEMNAFLLSWLSQLSCRVLNRPAGTSLCGPNWRPLQWAHAAARAGFQINEEMAGWRVPAVHRRKPKLPKKKVGHVAEVTVVGDRCFGDASRATLAYAKKLALIAGTDLLSVRLFASSLGSHFRSANPIPALTDPKVAQIVCDYLVSRGE